MSRLAPGLWAGSAASLLAAACASSPAAAPAAAFPGEAGIEVAAESRAHAPGPSQAPTQAQADPVPAASVAYADAASAAAAFYRLHVNEGVGGVPTGAALLRYRPLLTQRLLQALEAAGRAHDAAVAADPGSKPPFADGDVFSSLFEGPDGFDLGQALALGEDAARIVVRLRHGEGADAAHWKDVAVMRREDGGWKLDDIEFGGRWDFAQGGTLLEHLREGS